MNHQGARPGSEQREVQNEGSGGQRCLWCECSLPPPSNLLKGVAWRAAFDKLFPALAVRTRLSLGEVHLHNLLKKKKTKPNLDSHPDRSESLAKLVHPF